eukprot:TRINITY_DN56344_c0_g1_i1.p1 TRINITY_DN56344_c0_g1~~TRINITY_DN56344_c0_g1_i1.p1  ORF type:complete len:487 (+),score=26.59 TRINITY_DN56344_c0_g1_i1:28-1461(+)
MDDGTPPKINYKPGETFSLRDAFTQWGIPKQFNEHISPEWQCQLPPVVSDQSTLLDLLQQEIPCLFPDSYAEKLFAEIPHDDSLKYVSESQWSVFTKPRVAMKGGWGKPGAPCLGTDHLRVVNSFGEVLTSPEALNLQMFLREEAAHIPPLPSHLEWPLQDSVFSPEHSVVLDNALRLSRETALTWWHLDDCGEFVYQVGLPVTEKPLLIGPQGKPVVKLFVVFPKLTYEMVFRDEDTNRTGKFCHLDLFNTPSGCLPSRGQGGLPEIYLVPLEAGGSPLLLPPNLPHCVLTVQTCVMIEQRRLSKFFLEDVVYFMRRATHWAEMPIFYKFVKDVLQSGDKELVDSEVTNPLMAIVTDKARHVGLRQRAYNALVALQHFIDVELPTTEAQLQEPDACSKSMHRVAEALESQEKGVTQFPLTDQFAGYIHILGKPRWGPFRNDRAQAQADHKQLEQARKAKCLKQTLADMTPKEGTWS